MFDSFSNLIIVLIPVAIVIGRIVSQARSKKESNPNKTPPKPIPLFFEEDYDEDEPEPVKKTVPDKIITPVKNARPAVVPLFTDKDTASGTEPRIIRAAGNAPSAEARTGRGPEKKAEAEERNFPVELNHLSPIKQAVVMAEVLGPPKALQ